jgi:hypothetical protein
MGGRRTRGSLGSSESIHSLRDWRYRSGKSIGGAVALHITEGTLMRAREREIVPQVMDLAAAEVDLAAAKGSDVGAVADPCIICGAIRPHRF